MTYPQGPIPTTLNSPILTAFFVSSTLYGIRPIYPTIHLHYPNPTTQANSYHPHVPPLSPKAKGQHSCLTPYHIHPPSCLITPRHWLMPPPNHHSYHGKQQPSQTTSETNTYSSNLTYEYVLNCPSTVKDT